jgi:hypothetical protein
MSLKTLTSSLASTCPAALAFALLATPASASVTSISSSAYVLGLDLTVGGTTIAPGPIITASGSSPPAYNVQNALPTFSIPGLLTAGPLGASAISFFPPTPDGGSSAIITNLSLSFGSLLDITATEIASSSTVSGAGTPVASGVTTIQDLTISGLAIGATPIDVTGSPAANSVIFDNSALGLEITLNKQTPDLAESAGVTTIAMEIEFNGFPFGDNAINGGVDIAGAYASITAAPEPATWVEILSGFVVFGFLIGRRPRPQQMV